jgi:hypothetical protein
MSALFLSGTGMAGAEPACDDRTLFSARLASAALGFHGAPPAKISKLKEPNNGQARVRCRHPHRLAFVKSDPSFGLSSFDTHTDDAALPTARATQEKPHAELSYVIPVRGAAARYISAVCQQAGHKDGRMSEYCGTAVGLSAPCSLEHQELPTYALSYTPRGGDMPTSASVFGALAWTLTRQCQLHPHSRRRSGRSRASATQAGYQS